MSTSALTPLRYRLARLYWRVRVGGLGALPGWAWRWLYWNAQLHRLRFLFARLAPAPSQPPVCENVKTWSATHTRLETRVIAPAQVVTRRLPRTVEPEVHAAFTSRLRYEIPEKYLTCIPGALLVGANGLVVLPDGAYALEVAYNMRLLAADPVFDAPLPKQIVEKRGRYWSSMLYWASTGNYYHWMHDVLLKAYQVLDFLPEDVRIIVPADLRPFQRETLASLGIPSDRLEYFGGSEAWGLETLYFSPPTSHSGHDSPAADLWLRERIFAACNVAFGNPRKRIYISRRQAARRKITNEGEVEACLRGFGFETVLTENMSICEQAVLFAQAAQVVSNHGAGLTNILFAPPGTKVLEIQDLENVRPGCWIMSEALGHQYSYLLGEPAEGSAENRFDIPGFPVQVEKLTAALDQMLAI